MKSLTIWALFLCGLVAVSLAQSVDDEDIADIEDIIEDAANTDDDDDVSAEIIKRAIKDGEFDANELEDDDFEDDDVAEDEELMDDTDDEMNEDDSFEDGFEDDDVEHDPLLLLGYRRRFRYPYYPFYRRPYGFGLGYSGFGARPFFDGENSESRAMGDSDDDIAMADQMKMMGKPFRRAYKILGANQICFAIKQLKPSIRKRVVMRIFKKRVMKEMTMRRRKGMKTYMKLKTMQRRRRPCRPRCTCRTPTGCKRRGYKKQPTRRYWRYKRLRSYLMRMILQGRLTAMPLPY